MRRRAPIAGEAVAAAAVLTTALGLNVAADARVARAEVPEVSACTSDAGLAIGATGSSVACLQFMLAALDSYHGTLTQKYDRLTAEAMALFQADHPPLRVDGIGTPQVLIEMGIYSGVDKEPPPLCLADARLGSGSKGASVKCLQDKLIQEGYMTGASTGAFDKATADALRAFQSGTPPLPVDGIAGPSTLAALGVWSGKTTEQGGQIIVPTAQAASGPWPAGREPFPNWNLTNEGIPYFGNHVACNRADADIIAAEFEKDGADDATQQWAAYIASREGGCRYTTVNLNLATRDDSHCTFQLNALAGMFEPHGELGRRGWTVDNVKESMAELRRRGQRPVGLLRPGPWTPPYACAKPWAGDLGLGDA